jgi:hypothetical protein
MKEPSANSRNWVIEMPMASRTPQEAVAAMQLLHTDNVNVGVGECLHTCRTAWGLPGGSPSAAAQWESIPASHKHSGPAPLGAPIFWTGGSEGFGHIALSNGKGSVWSTDLPVNAHVGLVSVDQVIRSWPNHRLAGWASMLEGYDLPLSSAHKGDAS